MLALRDYQRRAVDAVTAAAVRGCWRYLIALPTVSGKTVIFARLERQRPSRTQGGTNEHDPQIVRASVQTLPRKDRLARLVPDFNTVIVDEGSH